MQTKEWTGGMAIDEKEQIIKDEMKRVVEF